MKVGDLVRYTPAGVFDSAWAHWVGIIIDEVPGTERVKVVMWNRDNNVKTNTREYDLKIIKKE